MNISRSVEAFRSLAADVVRPLVLHMDINRTIIQTDPAGGKSLTDVLNSNVAAEVYGEFVDGLFTPRAAPSEEPALSDWISYSDYCDKVNVPKVDLATLPDDAARLKAWKEVSEGRRAMLKRFTNEGAPGAAYAGFVVQQTKALTYDDQLHEIIPSFFHLVNALSAAEISFSVVFRTFGEDGLRVVNIWRQFLNGTHIIKPIGNRLKEWKEKDIPFGCLYRNDQGMAVTWKRQHPVPPPPPAVDPFGDPQEYLRTLEKADDAHNVSFDDLFSEISHRSLDGCCVLVDYYHHWAKHQENRSAGKVFPVVMGHAAPCQVFFDDNIFIGDTESIVDVRCAATGEPLVLSNETELAYCCQVRPLWAILDEEYFAKELLKRIPMQAKLNA